MSEYGPAIFCKRKDGEPLTSGEQERLLKQVKKACSELKIVDNMDRAPAAPREYDYDGYEANAVSFVLWSDCAFGVAPEPVQEDFHQDAKDLSERIGAHIERGAPKTYAFDGYYVEV